VTSWSAHPAGESDDTGVRVDVPVDVGRVVSLVPSLTEAVAVSAPGLLVGATQWCTHPGDLVVARVRGTKNPDVDAVLALRPDVVLANAEENRAVDVASLRDVGLPVWVTAPETLDAALLSLERMLRFACRLPSRPPWLEAARAAWAQPHTGERRRAAVPIWRRPWMVLGRDTFAGDVLRRLGVDNVFADAQERYPRTSVAEIRGREPDLVVLPDEPYAFSADDGPEAYDGIDVALVSGRHLTWYGPSLVGARELLLDQLGRTL
jgi:ABC-type Fe3+-hydroxamate transport system substrate-binding protein